MGWPEQVFNWLGYGRYTASPVAASDGGTKPLLVDPYGKLRVLAEISGASTYSQYKPLTGADKKGLIKDTPGSLRYVQVSSKDASGCWLLLLDQDLIPVGSEITVVFPVWVPAGETRAVELPADLTFSAGIAWAASSSMGEVTLMAGQHLWVNALYL